VKAPLVTGNLLASARTRGQLREGPACLGKRAAGQVCGEHAGAPVAGGAGRVTGADADVEDTAARAYAGGIQQRAGDRDGELA
jgi:hypothetical protein